VGRAGIAEHRHTESAARHQLPVRAAPALSSSHSTKAGSLYWSKSSPRVYRCEGARSAVSCRSDAYRPRYSVLVSKGRVYLSFNGSVLVTCETAYRPASNCEDFLP
jgi:hypothetical protein